MKLVSLVMPSWWWLALGAVALGLLIWQGRRLKLSLLSGAALGCLLLALLNPVVLAQPETTGKAEFHLQMVKPRVLLVEYGGGRTFLGTVLGGGPLSHTDVVSPENLSMVADIMKRYDVVLLHAAKNLQVYTDYFSDWRSFPNRSKLESVFSDYGVVFDSGTLVLPSKLEDYGLVILAGADIKAEDSERLMEYVKGGGRLLVLLHAAGGLAVNPPGTSNPYCILYHHPPFGDIPFPEDKLQRNTARLLKDRLGVRSMENISCTYGKVVVQKSELSVLPSLYGDKLYPDANIDGKGFDKLDWTTAFVDYDPVWQPLLKIDTRYTGEPRGHGTPVPLSVNGKAVGIARRLGEGRVSVFGLGSVNFGISGVPPSLLLLAAPYIGAEVTLDESTCRSLANCVTEGGNLIMVGAGIPKSSGAVKLADLLPVNISGPQIAEVTRAVFRQPSHPVLMGISPFAISRYRVSATRATGEVLAADGKNNPVLVTSYYGQGKVVYYLPEIPVQATLENTAPPEFWRRLVAWLAPATTDAPGFNSSLKLTGGEKVPLTLHLWDDEGKAVEKAEVSVSYSSPQGITSSTVLKETFTGTYTGELTLPEAGDYRVWFNVKALTVNRTPPVTVTVGSSPFSSVEGAVWWGISFLNGYQSAAPTVMPLPLWQFLVLVGATLLSIDWTRSILQGRL